MHAHEVADSYSETNPECKCAAEHRQLAGWLEELEFYRQGKYILVPRDSHQPLFVKDDALSMFDQWNDVTGAIPKGTSWYYEAQGVIEQIAAMAFGAGIFYEADRMEAQDGNNQDL